MSLRLAGTLSVLSVLLMGCGARDGGALPPNALRVEVGDVAWAAYQDGDGSWQPLPEGTATSAVSAAPLGVRAVDPAQRALLKPELARRMPRLLPSRIARQLEPLQTKEVVLSITDAQGRYGLAYICLDDDPSYGYSDLDIRLSTLTTDSDRTLRCYSGEDEPSYILSGTVEGLGAEDQGVVYSFLRDPVLVDATNQTYGFELWPDLYDVIATRYSGSDTAPNKIVVHNDVSVEANQTLDLDFESDLALTPVILQASITDVTEGLSPSGGVAIASKNFTLAGLGGVGSGTAFDYAFIPPQKLGNEADVYAYADGTNGSGAKVSLTRDLLSPADITLSLPEPLSGARVAVQGPTPYRFPTATWNAYPGEDATYGLFYFQSPLEGPFSSAFVYIDQSWLGSAATYSYAVPDLSAVAGWDSDWNLKAGVELEWSISAYAERNSTTESRDYISAEQSGTLP